MMIDVSLENDGEWDSSTDWQGLADRAVRTAALESAFPKIGFGEKVVEVSIRLSSDEEVCALNREWRDRDKPTNVLSFPMAEEADILGVAAPGPELLLGDIILAHGVCAREAAEKALPIADHAAHLIVHGTLHLLGHDHLDDADADDMEAREVRAMARLGLADPYGDRG